MRSEPTWAHEPGAPAFEVVRPTGTPRPVLVHVPHSGLAIPENVREGLLLEDAELERELLLMTDHRTDVLAAGAPAQLREVDARGGLPHRLHDTLARRPDLRPQFLEVVAELLPAERRGPLVKQLLPGWRDGPTFAVAVDQAFRDAGATTVCRFSDDELTAIEQHTGGKPHHWELIDPISRQEMTASGIDWPDGAELAPLSRRQLRVDRWPWGNPLGYHDAPERIFQANPRALGRRLSPPADGRAAPGSAIDLPGSAHTRLGAHPARRRRGRRGREFVCAPDGQLRSLAARSAASTAGRKARSSTLMTPVFRSK